MEVIYYCSVKNFSWRQLERNIKILSNEDQKRILKLQQDNDKCLSLAGKMLLLYSLKEQGIWKEIFLPQISYSSHNRPYFTNLACDFNIAHSGDLVVCYLSKDSRVGVDIERIKLIAINDYKEVFTEHDFDKILTSTNPIFEFYRFWTCLEAIIKADGNGFSLDTKRVIISNNECTIHDITYSLFNLVLDNEYAFCIVSSKISEKTIRKLFINSNNFGLSIYFE